MARRVAIEESLLFRFILEELDRQNGRSKGHFVRLSDLESAAKEKKVKNSRQFDLVVRYMLDKRFIEQSFPSVRITANGIRKLELLENPPPDHAKKGTTIGTLGLWIGAAALVATIVFGLKGASSVGGTASLRTGNSGSAWYLTPYEGHAGFRVNETVVMSYAQCLLVVRQPPEDMGSACKPSWPGERFRVLSEQPAIYSNRDGLKSHYWYVTSLNRPCTGWASDVRRTEIGHIALCAVDDLGCQTYAAQQPFLSNNDNRQRGTYTPEYCSQFK